MSVPCTSTVVSNPCSPCASIDSQNVCGQTLSLDSSTGDLFITPSGNSINLCPAVKFCETQTLLQDVFLTGNVLQVVYIGESGVPQTKNVDLSPLVADITASFTVAPTNSIDLTYNAGVLQGNLKVDPASTISISASSSGVLFNAPSTAAITANTTNTIQLIASGSQGHILTANLKSQSTGSITLSSSSAGLSALVNYSSDANNVALPGSDGGIYVQSAASQLSALPLNGNAVPNSTLLVGSDSKLYTVQAQAVETPITTVNTSTLTLVASGVNTHTIQGHVNFVDSDTISMFDIGSGLGAGVKVDNSLGNVQITAGSTGLYGTVSCSTFDALLPTQATVANPMTKVYGKLNDGSCGFVNSSFTKYGPKLLSLSAAAITALPAGDLYDALLIFNSTARAFQWYDGVNNAWVQLS